MATIEISNSWGFGLDMSAYDDEGWGVMPADELSGTLYTGYNNIIFDSYGYASFDALGINYFLYDDLQTVILEDIWYFQGATPVLKLNDVNILTTISVLNSPTWVVRFNQGDDTFDGNDYADYIKGGYGNDLIGGYGGADALFGNDGNDWIGGGAGNDLIVGGNGYDTAGYGGFSTNYIFSQNSDGSVTVADLTGGWGTDILVGIEALSFDNGIFALSSLLPVSQPPDPFTGDAAGNTLYGNAGPNLLRGLGGNDRIFGAGGSDRIHGGTGNDILTGGAGKDYFVFDTKPNRWTNRDTITDFRVVDDTIRLENAVFTKVGSAGSLKSAAFHSNLTGKAHDRDDRIIYETDTGKLFYDADGTGSTAAVHFATVGKNLALNKWDFAII